MKTILPLALFAISSSTFALEVIYDEDAAAGVTSKYTHGPINEVIMNTRSTQYIEARYILDAKDNLCTKATLLDEQTWNVIAQLQIIDNAVATGSVPEGYETKDKSLQLDCSAGEKEYSVHHKIPAAPKITWDASVNVSDWTDGGFKPGYYNDIDYTSNVGIDNNAPDGRCFFETMGQSSTPNVIKDKNNLVPFSYEQFNVQGKAEGSEYLVSQIVCRNAGGITRATELWDLGSPSSHEPKRDFHISHH